MPNPWMGLWMSTANACTGAARYFWTVEMRRQQTAMLNEMNRQMVRFWTRAWAQPSSQREDQDEAALRCLPTLRQVAKLTICRHDMITALAVTVQVPETLL